MSLILALISMICVLISVAFYTVIERKILSYIQIRKGPNKVGMAGLFQPFADAIKLFNKHLLINDSSNQLILVMSPSLSFFLSLIIIPLIPFAKLSFFDSKHNFLLFMIISSISVYSILLMGWSSNSKYSSLGSIRSIAQMISYEVSFFLIILFLCILISSYNFSNFENCQKYLFFIFGNFILFIVWMSSCLAEVNRSPFDFAEGESELVSGFNVEYMGGMFALIFLAEYTSMLILSLMTTFMFFSSIIKSFLIFVLISIILLWVRGSFPRFRYDLLMQFNWMVILPVILFSLITPPIIFSLAM